MVCMKRSFNVNFTVSVSFNFNKLRVFTEEIPVGDRFQEIAVKPVNLFPADSYPSGEEFSGFQNHGTGGRYFSSPE